MSRWPSFVFILLSCVQSAVLGPSAAIAAGDENVDNVLNTVTQTDLEAARKKWTYNGMISKSDAVVIGVFVGAKIVKSGKIDSHLLAGYRGYVAVESRFRVIATLQPHKQWKKRPAFISLVHFVWRTNGLRSKAPQFIDFSSVVYRQKTIDIIRPRKIVRHSVGKPVKFDNHQEFLMFLTSRQDGRYEPVTGQFFPHLSFRKLTKSRQPEVRREESK